MTNIAFIGVGGIGGFFGGKMARLLPREDLRIFFIARGAHLRAIREKGLQVNSKDSGNFECRPTLATDRISDLPLLDLCFLCVKQYDLNSAVAELVPKLKKDTKIIPLLNGIDIAERIRGITAQGTLIPACVYIGTHIASPGVVEQNGGACKIFLEKPAQEADLASLEHLLNLAEIRHEWSEDCRKEIWSKYLFIAAYGLITAAYGKTIGEVYTDSVLSERVRGIIKEMLQLSRKAGVSLPADAEETAYRKAAGFPYETKTSFQRDYEAGKRDERELFGQTILDLGKKYAVPVCETERTYRLLVERI